MVLQFGIIPKGGQTYWYNCPEKGGALYVPGYSGFIECPVPSEFCLQEEISGKVYTVSSVWAEWVIAVIVLGSILAMYVFYSQLSLIQSSSIQIPMVY